MMLSNIASPLLEVLLLVIIRRNYAQLTAVITPRGYNASLDPEASFTFQCDVTGSDTTNIIIQWLVDGSSSFSQEIRDRGFSESSITMDEATGTFRRNLSIPIGTNSKNTTIIICVATAISSTGMVGGSDTSEAVILRIQGLLDAPLNLISDTNNQHMRRLSWDEPFSLDITDVDPDIECYNCATAWSMYQQRNPSAVGEGEATSILHDGCSCTNATAPSIISAAVSFPLSQNIPMANFLFQQLSEDSGTLTCFLVYEVKTSVLSEANTSNHGIQIPRVVQHSQSSVHLSLTVNSDLLVNEIYLATITAMSADGERNISVTVEFNTYDVQSVSGRAIPGGLELNCTFADGSQAQSCTLTISRILEDGTNRFVVNVSTSQVKSHSSGRILNLDPGEYVVREVAEVESDGQVTTHRRRSRLILLITELAPITTSEVPTIGGDIKSPTQNIGAIVGGIVTVLTMLLFAGIIFLFVIVTFHRQKLHHRNQETPQVTAVYEDPCEMAVPQTKPVMEQCPAYGVLTK